MLWVPSNAAKCKGKPSLKRRLTILEESCEVKRQLAFFQFPHIY